ncbi:MAG: glycosyltransferase, partial [Phycisphaeraceae bacterium]
MSPDKPEVQAWTINHLRNQSIADQLEVVVICQEPGEDVRAFADEYLSGFHAWQIIQCEKTSSLAGQHALSIEHASAPLVALGEDHCQPDVFWAEELVKAYAEDDKIAGVSPEVCYANRQVWAMGSQLIDYTPWTGPAKPGDLKMVSVTNATYRRDLLVEIYGDKMADMVRRGGNICDDLRNRGYRFVMHPASKCYHKNISTFGQFFLLRFTIGRYNTANDLDGAGLGKRIVVGLLAPLLSLKRFAVLTKKLAFRGYPLSPKMLFGMAVGLTIDCLGSVLGAFCGKGSSLTDIYQLEFKREPRMHAYERERDYVAEYNPEVKDRPGYIDPVV